MLPLHCTPTVFMIDDDYEIIVTTKKHAIIFIEVDGETFYEENNGVLSSEKLVSKIRVPKEKLDKAKRYTVAYSRTLCRKAYFSEVLEPDFQTFEFSPMLKTEDINIYHLADMHFQFDLAEKAFAYLKGKCDMIIINGDFGEEVNEEKNYIDVLAFLGEISEGRIPTVIVRGNHDTRGALAEKYADYFPTHNKLTYFTFETPSLFFVCLDLGEDKLDSNRSYGGVNIFEIYRRRELEFLKKLQPKPGKTTLVIGHICPARTSFVPNTRSDIERELYAEYNKEIERLGTKLYISGHMHEGCMLEKNDKKSLLPHNYNVLVGSECDWKVRKYWGTALNVSTDKINIKFTDMEQKVTMEYDVDLKNDEIITVKEEV